MLLDKAMQLALLNDSEKSISPSWISHWKTRHGISSKRLVGEASSVDAAVVDEWRSKKVPHLTKEFSPNNLYNINETGLFWRLLPSQTMAFLNEKVKGGKQSKDRITVLVGGNAAGDKLPLLAIGRSKSQRCFPKDQSKLPLVYKNNKQSWMTTTIFEEWVRSLNQSMVEQDHVVALVLDNCTAHPQVTDLDNLKMIFLPPNTTSHTQPMDAGIINSLKHQYRKRVARKYLVALETGATFSFDLLKCLELLKMAWDSVTRETIINCFKKVGLSSLQVVTSNVEAHADQELDTIIDQIRYHTEIPSEVDSEIFVNCDNSLDAVEVPTDQELLESFQCQVDEEEVVETVAHSDAIEAVDLLRRYMVQSDDTSQEILSSLVEMENFVECNVLQKS